MRTCLIASLWVWTLAIPAAVCAQTPLAPAPQVQAAPNGAVPQRSSLKEGQPVESRLPEKRDDNSLFPEQTRAPYHSSAPFRVTTLIDNLPAPWSLAFLPDGKILLTERLPGSIRILDIKGDTTGDTKGVLSEPVAGVAGLASPGAKDIGLLDVVLDPHFAANHQIFFTFFDY